MTTPNNDNRGRKTFRPGQQTASVKDLMIGETRREGAGRYFDPIETLARGSVDPEVFLPLGNHTKRELARDMRIVATMNVVYTLETNMPQVMWFGYQGAIGVNAQGRRDLLAGIGARRQERLNNMRGYNAMHERFNNSDQGAPGNGRLTA